MPTADLGDEGARPDPAAPAAVLTYEEYLRQQAARRPLVRFSALVCRGLRLVWRAARGPLCVAAGLQAASGLAVGGQVLLLRHAVDILVRVPGDRTTVGRLLSTGAALAALFLLIKGAEAVRYGQTTVLAEYVQRATQSAILDVASSTDLSRFDNHRFFDELQRATAGQQTPLELTSALLSLISDLVGLASVTVALAFVEPWALPVTAIAFVPALVVRLHATRELYSFRLEMIPIERRRNSLWGWLAARDMAKEIRAYGLGDHFRGRWEELQDKQIDLSKRVIRRLMGPQLVVLLATSLMIFGSLLGFALLVHNGRTGLPAAGAGLGAVVLAQPRIQMVVAQVSALYDCALYLETYESFLAIDAKESLTRPRSPAPGSFDVLRVEGVGFSYPGATVPSLSEVSLEIARGEIVAVVGENGSGKTTLAKLLCGLYPPDEGRVLWDGTDTATVDQEQLRRGVAVLFQDFARYLLSARDNIALGDCTRPTDDEGVLLAGQRAGADSFLSRFPDGYDTLLGPEFEGGRDLSIGQWQRIALARAFFRGAPFIILDEPTAAMDPRAEHELFASIRELCAGRTVLLISHRFSSVRNADRIFVLHRGRLVESGSHTELLQQHGRYEAMFRMQAAAYTAEAAAKQAEATAEALADA